MKTIDKINKLGEELSAFSFQLAALGRSRESPQSEQPM